MITCLHSAIFSDFFDIDPHAKSDIEFNNIKIEIKEASVRKVSKNSDYTRVSFTIKRKDLNQHHYFIFFDSDLIDFYLVDAKIVDKHLLARKFKNSTRLSLNFVKNNSILKTSNLHEIKEELSKK